MGELKPASEQDVADIVRDAAANGMPLDIRGGGTRGGYGAPVQAASTLDLSSLAGITAYEPSEMVITARAGTTMEAIGTALAENRQRLLFEPMDHRALFDIPGEPTIGGVTAGNVSGPRRFVAGAARDHLLGLRFVNGRGEAVKAGGRVMKNVTGLDLPKVLAGSWGTLGVLTEVTFKVSPRPETEATLRLIAPDEDAAVRALASAMATPCEPTGAAVLPDEAGSPRIAVLRLEGFDSSIRARTERLRTVLGDFEVLDAEDSDYLWRDVRDVQAYLPDRETPLWKVSVAPSRAPSLLDAVRAKADAHALLDWQGGLIWLASEIDGATLREEIVLQGGGHATLMRAPHAVRAAGGVVQPQPAALAALNERVRASLDPHRIFNPGRLA